MEKVSLSGKKVLVTGGSGFIGRCLCHELMDSGCELWVLSRNRQRAARQLIQGVRIIERLEEIAGIDFFAVINLAGEPLGAGRWNAVLKSRFRQSRIELTRELFQFFERQQQWPSVLINASAIGIYGDRGEEILSESAVVGQGFAAALCYDWEAAASLFEAHAVRVCLLRIGIVLDADGGALKQMLPAFRFGLGGRMGTGKQYMSWISRRDLVRLILFLLVHPGANGACNGVVPEPVTNREFAATLAACLGRPAFLPMPALLLRLLFGEMADALLLSSQRVVPEKVMRLGFCYEDRELRATLEKILKK